MIGGVICGYWATGSDWIDTAPARVMTIDSTAAKIGRSMKKRENTAGHPPTNADRSGSRKGRPSRCPGRGEGTATPGRRGHQARQSHLSERPRSIQANCRAEARRVLLRHLAAAALPGLASTLARGFIPVAFQAPKPVHPRPLSPEGAGTKAPGERTRESG